jgi:hypothetical protein
VLRPRAEPDEYAAPVTIGACQTQRCGADPAALAGTWTLEQGCANRSSPFGCDNVRFFPRVAAAGTVSFTSSIVSFDIDVYSENTVEVPLFCFGAETCAQLDGFLSQDSTCEDIGEGFCKCEYYLVEPVQFEISYTIEGDVMRTGFGEDYDICLLGDRLSLTHFTPGEQDLENYTLVRGGD